MLVIRITAKQEESLQRQARENGFSKKSEYVRVALFKNKVVQNG